MHITAQKQVDSTWTPSTGDGAVNALALSNGVVYVAGSFTTMNGGTQRNRLAAVNAAGQPSPGALTSWNPNANAPVNDVRISGTSVYVVGTFTNVGSAARSKMAELSQAGTGWRPDGATG